MDKELFSPIRLRQILNGLKRRPEDAAKELNISHTKMNKILDGKLSLSIVLVKKMLKVWPITIESLINSKFFSHETPSLKIFKKEESIKTSRIMKRDGKNYYEYRDTVMEKNAPFRPEWIRTICHVDNDKANNKKVIWNKGHLLHQFTYFVGNINFYYLDKYKKKRVCKMKMGDSMYISPYVPHSFASRDDKLNFIIALTYLDKITIQLQDTLNLIGHENTKKTLIDITNKKKSTKKLIARFKNNLSLTDEEIKKRIKNRLTSKNWLKNYSGALSVNLKDLLGFDDNKKIIIKKNSHSEGWYFPSKKNQVFLIKELASSKFVPEAKAIEIKVLKKNNLKLQNYCHQYIYVLGENLILKQDKKKYILKKDDTFYLKPHTKFSIQNKYASNLILRVPGLLSGDKLLQLSQVEEKNISRVIKDNSRWY